jgi:crotonobetainyl-CoA:carnitine CoA-transferase CaiB-like acyl-CoA transferase
LYAAREGWIAVAALEPHFARRLADALGLAGLETGTLRERFTAETAEWWQRWAREKDLPIVAVRLPSEETS